MEKQQNFVLKFKHLDVNRNYHKLLSFKNTCIWVLLNTAKDDKGPQIDVLNTRDVPQGKLLGLAE